MPDTSGPLDLDNNREWRSANHYHSLTFWAVFVLFSTFLLTLIAIAAIAYLGVLRPHHEDVANIIRVWLYIS